MSDSNHITPEEQGAIAEALQLGEIDQVFQLLAAYLVRNRLTLSDETLKLYLEQELFACLEGRGGVFGSI